MRLDRHLPPSLIATLAFFVSMHTAAAQTGSVKGKFVLEGKLPDLPPKVEKDANAKDGQVCATEAVPDQTYLVNPTTKGLANVFIWVPRIDKEDIPAEYKKPKSPTVEIDNKGCQFVPHCAIAMEGQQLKMVNADAVAHNVHLSAIRGKGINQLVGPNNRIGVVKPLKADILPMTVKCDIHPWMEAHLLILEHPYAALSNEIGVFTIVGLPEGIYDLRVWHESQGYIKADTRRVEVKAGTATDLGELKIMVK